MMNSQQRISALLEVVGLEIGKWVILARPDPDDPSTFQVGLYLPENTYMLTTQVDVTEPPSPVFKIVYNPRIQIVETFKTIESDLYIAGFMVGYLKALYPYVLRNPK